MLAEPIVLGSLPRPNRHVHRVCIMLPQPRVLHSKSVLWRTGSLRSAEPALTCAAC
jgi:hypothetical protein